MHQKTKREIERLKRELRRMLDTKAARQSKREADETHSTGHQPRRQKVLQRP